jgi:[histone H4]-lysine20 N-methyltransferase SETD8
MFLRSAKPRSTPESKYKAISEQCVEVFDTGCKGRGVRALRAFSKGDYVLEYKGELISAKEGHKRHSRYSVSEGSYMFFFRSEQGESLCVDATAESPYKCRLVNHSRLRPNTLMGVISAEGKSRLILQALTDISVGTELLYDYGEKDTRVIAGNPWLVNS